jgi:hypothetical protein
MGKLPPQKHVGLRYLPLMGLALCFVALPAHAQTLQEQVSLDFGSLIVAGPGSVTIPATSDTRSASGGVAPLGATTAARGSLVVLGPAGNNIQITFPATIPIPFSSGAAVLEPLVENGPFQTIPPSGRLLVHLGGALSFSGGEGEGAAQTDIFVTIDFLP